MTVSLTRSLTPQPSPTIASRDVSGLFEPTLNGTGYTIWSLDGFSQRFVDCAAARPNETALDIGAGFGVATLAALQRGATVIANDCEPRHLDVLWSRTPIESRSRLTLRPGDFPNGLELPPSSLSAVLISRVFHFFDGPSLERSVRRLHEWLRPNGQVFVICEESLFLDEPPLREEYERRLAEGLPWPGFVDDVHRRLPHKSSQLPDQLHYLDPRMLASVFESAKFHVVDVRRFPRFAGHSDERLRRRVCLGLAARKM